MTPVTLDDIYRARERIAPFVERTPLLPALGLDVPRDNQLWLKAECFQRTGSFKLRGATNAIAGLSDEERARGVITYSSGNHGQAVACAARLLGIRAVIVMPEDAIPVKVALTREWGAEIEFAGLTSLARQERALELAEQYDYVVIPPFDDARIIAGQGTIGLEIVEQLPDVEAVVVQVGGGGLMSGIATAIKGLRPEAAVIGVEPEGAADAQESLRRGTLTTWDHIETVADGLRTSRVGALNFELISRFVDEIVTVSDAETLTTVGRLALHCKLVSEPSGAVAPAAVLGGKTNLAGKRVVVVVSGGNIAPSRLEACLEAVAENEEAHAPV